MTQHCWAWPLPVSREGPDPAGRSTTYDDGDRLALVHDCRSPENAAVSGVAVDEWRALGCDAEQLADERVGLAVAVAVDRDECLGEQVVEGDGEQVDQTVDRGAGRAADSGLILEAQDRAGAGRFEVFFEAPVNLVRCRVAGKPGVGVAHYSGILHGGLQHGLGVLPAGADGDPAGLVEQRVDRHYLNGPIERQRVLKPGLRRK